MGIAAVGNTALHLRSIDTIRAEGGWGGAVGVDEGGRGGDTPGVDRDEVLHYSLPNIPLHKIGRQVHYWWNC